MENGGWEQGRGLDFPRGCLLALAAGTIIVLLAAWMAVAWEQARGDRVQAQVSLINAETARDREANLHREAMFEHWTVALAAFSSSNDGWLVVLSALLGAGAAVIVIQWWEKRAGSS